VAEQRFLGPFRSVFDRLVNLLTAIAAGLLVPMMFLVSGDVVGRYIFNHPLPAVFEINSDFLMVLVVFFPLAYVHRCKEHVFITLFTDPMPAKVRATLETISVFIGLVSYGLIGVYSLQRALIATRVREYTSGVIDVPVWLAKWIIPIGCFAFCIELFLDGLDHLRLIFGRASSGEVPRG
jgi:TRAP-type C4-dicarboxylate transport system permease small subunit